ncbi:molybdopterin-guanine dinucleotide biosynthesis protein A [Rhodoligotrophos appendicifer]|uniref:molybdenum cofactor guanylyltransferase MobA n=1 Tax=Rhodoligotrophos appendicifer TaxID=987056 RepID=UPI001186D6A9|nr:molybdenum cofactor guanylyltransferase MobA [Rhodoligotrophos appendicifer]
MKTGGRADTIGVVLAGGRSQRMGGGDKGLLAIGGRSLLERVIARLAPQCAGVVVNANGDPARFSAFALPIAADSVPGFAGPLAGLLAGLDWAAAHHPEMPQVASVSGDCPFLPRDLVSRLAEQMQSAGAPMAIARSGARLHPTVGLWDVSLRENLREAVLQRGLRRVQDWLQSFDYVVADWETTPIDPFFNVNRPEDLQRAVQFAGLVD